jgi:hypothetical protein
LTGGWKQLYIEKVDMCLLFSRYCQNDKISFEIRITHVEGCKISQLHTIWKPDRNRGVENPFED